jgi:hypothetical protein
MRMISFLAIVAAACMTLSCTILNVEGHILSPLSQSQNEYGSRGTYTSDANTVMWNYKGWIIHESYGSDGYCTHIVYFTAQNGSSISNSAAIGLLRMNTPNGVAWKHDGGNRGWEAFTDNWHSTEFIINGFVLSMVAKLYPIMPDHFEPNSVITPSYALSIELSP